MKIKYLILCFVASLLASCGEIDESNLKLYPSKLYLGVSGYNLQEIYDLGEESLVWDVYVDKSGYYDNAAEVELSYDPTVLTDYQELTRDGAGWCDAGSAGRRRGRSARCGTARTGKNVRLRRTGVPSRQSRRGEPGKAMGNGGLFT